MKFKEAIANLIAFFGQERIDYALIGAFALNAYGYVRATQDVDFVVREEAQGKIVQFLESLGYETLHRSRGFSNHLHAMPGLGRIDFVYVGQPTGDLIFSEAKMLQVLQGMSIPVTKVEHLIALKVFAMKNDPSRRFREMADIEQLLALPDLNMKEIESYFAEFGQMEWYHELVRGKTARS